MANVLNAYDSLYGNTKEVATIIGNILSDQHKVVTVEMVKATPELMLKADVFIIGSPIHYWRPSANTATFLSLLQRERVRGRVGVCYDTRLDKMMAGNAAAKITKTLFSMRFTTMLGNGESFYVESFKGPLKLGEVSKAERFAERIQTFIAARHVTSAQGFSLPA